MCWVYKCMAKHSGEKFQASWLLTLLLYPHQNIYIVQLFSLQKQNKIIKASILKTVNVREMIDSVEWELFKFIVARHDEVLVLNTTTHPFQGRISVSIKLLLCQLWSCVVGLRRCLRDKFCLATGWFEKIPEATTDA